MISIRNFFLDILKKINNIYKFFFYSSFLSTTFNKNEKKSRKNNYCKDTYQNNIEPNMYDFSAKYFNFFINIKDNKETKFCNLMRRKFSTKFLKHSNNEVVSNISFDALRLLKRSHFYMQQKKINKTLKSKMFYINVFRHVILQKNFFIPVIKRFYGWQGFHFYGSYYREKFFDTFKVNYTHNENYKNREEESYDLMKYEKILKNIGELFNPNSKVLMPLILELEQKIFNIDAHLLFKDEPRRFWDGYIKNFFLFSKYKDEQTHNKKFFIVQLLNSNRNNTIGFFNNNHKLIFKRTTKSMGLKTRKLRTDIFKTKFFFSKIFRIFKNFVKIKFKIKDIHKYLFIFCLFGDITKTSKVFKYITSSVKIKMFSLIDMSAVPHNGCRAPKRRRKKNRGRNRYSKKLIKN